MRSPEEIKKGLEYCSEKAEKKTKCSECIYFNDPRGWCSTTITKDALAYIQQLEARMEAFADEALIYIQQLEAKQPRWISVKKRFPEDGQKIIAAFRNEGGLVVDQARYSNGEFDFASWAYVWGDNVTHWMPLPQPPEEEEHE